MTIGRSSHPFHTGLRYPMTMVTMVMTAWSWRTLKPVWNVPRILFLTGIGALSLQSDWMALSHATSKIHASESHLRSSFSSSKWRSDVTTWNISEHALRMQRVLIMMKFLINPGMDHNVQHQRLYSIMQKSTPRWVYMLVNDSNYMLAIPLKLHEWWQTNKQKPSSIEAYLTVSQTAEICSFWSTKFVDCNMHLLFTKRYWKQLSLY